MELIIAFSQDSSCNLTIRDNTGFNPTTDGFIPENGVSTDAEYKLSEVYLHTYLVYNQLAGSTIVESNIRQIDALGGGTYASLVPDISLEMDYDGYYTVYYLAIPNRTISETVGRYDNLNPELLFYSDGINIYSNGTTTALNPLNVIAQLSTNTNIVNVSQEMFSTCRINKCYLDYIYSVSFDTLGHVICSSCDKNSDTNNRKKLLADAIFVIQSMIDQYLYMEAQNIVEQIMVCNGLCSDFSNFSTSSNCCSR